LKKFLNSVLNMLKICLISVENTLKIYAKNV